MFRKILRQVEAFSGVRVVTWTILSNHFHLLLEVPPRPEAALADDEILDRCRALYSRNAMVGIEWEHGEALRMGGEVHARWREKYLRRMWDLSEFMKTLKQKFTLWFNAQHDREGTLWERRFQSVLVEGSWKSLLKVAAYIDLNAVRAGMVSDPKDYRWCGYSEAVGGDRAARRGLVSALADLKAKPDWRDAAPRYRKVLFGIGEENAARHGISRAEVEKVFESGGRLTLPQLLTLPRAPLQRRPGGGQRTLHRARVPGPARSLQRRPPDRHAQAPRRRLGRAASGARAARGPDLASGRRGWLSQSLRRRIPI